MAPCKNARSATRTQAPDLGGTYGQSVGAPCLQVLTYSAKFHYTTEKFTTHRKLFPVMFIGVDVAAFVGFTTARGSKVSAIIRSCPLLHELKVCGKKFRWLELLIGMTRVTIFFRFFVRVKLNFSVAFDKVKYETVRSTTKPEGTMALRMIIKSALWKLLVKRLSKSESHAGRPELKFLKLSSKIILRGRFFNFLCGGL